MIIPVEVTIEKRVNEPFSMEDELLTAPPQRYHVTIRALDVASKEFRDYEFYSMADHLREPDAIGEIRVKQPSHDDVKRLRTLRDTLDGLLKARDA